MKLGFHNKMSDISYSLCVRAEASSCPSPQYGVTEPRKQAYADFYKQYDAVKEFNAMREAGIFESVRPSGE